jgi:hypothetical protein
MSLPFPVNTAAECLWTDSCILGETLKEKKIMEIKKQAGNGQRPLGMVEDCMEAKGHNGL